MASPTKKLSFMGLFLAVALILSYVESLFPFYFGVPGMKLGLANLTVVLALYLYGAKEALLFNLLRVFLSGLLFGNLYMMLYSAAGAITSFLAMIILKKTGKFTVFGVSMGGGVFHNIGQSAVAMLVIDTLGVIYYLPPLLIAGVVTGGLIGMIVTVIRPYLERTGNFERK